MSAKFTPGPYQREGRSIYKLVDNPEPKRGRPGQINLWLAGVSPCGVAVETAKLEAVATLFQASPLLYDVAVALDKWSRTANPMKLIQELDPIIEQCRAALRAARGEE